MSVPELMACERPIVIGERVMGGMFNPSTASLWLQDGNGTIMHCGSQVIAGQKYMILSDLPKDPYEIVYDVTGSDMKPYTGVRFQFPNVFNGKVIKPQYRNAVGNATWWLAIPNHLDVSAPAQICYARTTQYKPDIIFTTGGQANVRIAFGMDSFPAMTFGPLVTDTCTFNVKMPQQC